MVTTLLRHVIIIDPEGPYHEQEVNLQTDPSGKLTILEGDPGAGEGRVVDASGTYLSPGWVDTGTHLQDPGHEWIETLAALAEAARRGGFTTLLPYPSSLPIAENAEIIRALRSACENLPVEVIPLGAATEQLAGKEMAGLFEMHRAGAAGFSDGPIAVHQGSTLLRVLSYLRAFNGILLQGAISREWLEESVMHEGPVSTSLGLSGMPDVVELNLVQKSLNTLRYVGEGRIHFHPLSVPDAIDQIHAASMEGQHVSTGVPTYLFAFTDEDLLSFDENLKLVPPVRSADIQSQLRAHISEGKIQVLCSGHRAEGKEEKEVEFQQAEPGMLNLQTAFSQAVEGLIQTGHLGISEWVKMVSLNPRKIFRLKECHIYQGSDEWTWFSPDHTWKLTAADIPSRAKNSPYLGKTLTGLIKGSAVKGEARLYFEA